MHTENSLIDAALRGWKSNVERVGDLFGTLSPEQLEQQVTPREKPPDLSVGTSYSGERRALAAARHWRTASPGTRRNVHFETRRIHRTYGDGSISQVGMGQDQPEALGRIFEVLAGELGRAAYRRFGGRVQAGTKSK